MRTIGLTGGIGSGKSTVAGLFLELGVPVIDTDQLARAAVLPGTLALQKISEHFGPTVLLANGMLNRQKLRAIIFQDEKDRLWLEGLLHPIIRQLMAEQMAKIDAPYCIVQIPLLVGRTPNPAIQEILLVDTEPTFQYQRVQARDQLDQAEIQLIIDTQPSRTTLLAAADEVIVNNGSLADLKKQVLALHQKYLNLPCYNAL